MTISPQAPHLVQLSEKSRYRRLTEDHLTFVKVGFGYSLQILIREGYETDGASIPENLLQDKEYGSVIEAYIRGKYPKIKTRYDFENLVKILIGEPWDMPRLLAAIVHDALYGRKWKFRWLCDRVYKWILQENNYHPIRIDIEYAGIRMLGWRNWDKISNQEKISTRILTDIKLVKTKKLQKIIDQLTKVEQLQKK